METPIVGKQYTAKEMKVNGWSPCTHCGYPNLCASQCVWAYWNQGERENTLYTWNGTLNKDGTPKYTDSTWDRVD